MHLRGHRREGKHALDAERLGILDQPMTEGVFPDLRLRLADEDDDIPPPFGRASTED